MARKSVAGRRSRQSSRAASISVVIAPGGVFGPPLGDNIFSESLTILYKVLNGKIPMVPDAAFPMVDVRDVAKLHVQALNKFKVAGKRFIASGTNPISFAEVAQLLLNQGYKAKY